MSYHEVEVSGCQNKKFYVIGIFLDNPARQQVAQTSHCRRIYNRQLCFRQWGGMGGLSHTEPGQLRLPCHSCTSFVHLDYHSNKIKKFLRTSVSIY